MITGVYFLYASENSNAAKKVKFLQHFANFFRTD